MLAYSPSHQRWKPRQSLLALVLAATVAFALAGPGLAARPTLRLGSQGPHVEALQRRLAHWGYYRGPVDGQFGPLTEEAVRLFQKRNGLPEDGVVGRDTWILVGLWGAGTLSPVPLLARLVAAEAGGEPFWGQVAVAAVVLNRVEHPAFPDTVAEVVFEPGAFESVSNGHIWRKIPTSTHYQAVAAALDGYDPTGGAVFFWNPHLVSSGNWIWSRAIVRRIGQHVFAR